MERKAKRRRLSPKDASDSEDEQSVSSEEISVDDGQENEMSSQDEGDEESDEDEDDIIQQELAGIDFGTLANAQKSLSKRTVSSPKPKSSRPHSQSSKQPPPDIPSKPKSRSKNAPQEISSKRPVSRKHFLSTIPTHSSHQPRDPRFETLTKSSSQDTFRKAYSFLEDYQRDEIALLKTQIRQSKDDAEREKLEKALKSLQSRKESREAKDRAQSVLKAMKLDEREKIKLGKRPFYLKKSEEKKLVLEDKYSKLGKKRLEKVLEKKRKKKEGKELRRMPRQR